MPNGTRTVPLRGQLTGDIPYGIPYSQAQQMQAQLAGLRKQGRGGGVSPGFGYDPAMWQQYLGTQQQILDALNTLQQQRPAGVWPALAMGGREEERRYLRPTYGYSPYR